MTDKLAISIRKARIGDLTNIIDLTINTIRDINSFDYSPSQINVWIQSIGTGERLMEAINNQYFIIAESDNKLVGYGSLNNDLVDFLFVNKNYLRKGIAQNLLNAIIGEARKNKISCLHSKVSITAKSFFEKNDFKVLKEKKVEMSGISMTNFTMIKGLP